MIGRFRVLLAEGVFAGPRGRVRPTEREEVIVRSVLVCVRSPLAAQSVASCAARLGVAALRTAVTESEVMAQLTEQPAELILADTAVTRPDTAGFARRVLAQAPGAVLVLFGAEDPRVASAAVAAGARGVIRGGDSDLVGTVAKALLLIGSARATAGEPADPPAAVPHRSGQGSATRAKVPGTGRAGGPGPGGPGPGGPGPGGPGHGGPGPGRTGPAGGGGHRPPGEPDTGPALVPTQRSDLPGPGQPGWRPGGGRPRAGLTEREVQVLRGMAEGKSNAEIGRDLYVSEDTVKTHARRLFRKLGARDRAHAVAVGFRTGVLP
jgi:DNA-binding NarL/FixJ family response regulator